MSRLNRILGAASASTLAVMLADAGALAQSTPSEAAQPQAEDDDDTIVVTARKRQEGIQDVPFAVTAVGGDELEQRQVIDIEGLETVTPNLIVQPNTLSASGANIFLRGLGQGDFDRSFSPAVQVLFDEVRYGSSISGQLVNVLDVERIEVLRGPQGTLFGANAIGGVINIIRPKPEEEFGGNVEVTVGNYGRLDVEASVTGSLIEDKLQGRIAVVSVNSDGAFDNAFNGEDRGYQDILGISPSLRFTPTDNLTILATYDYLRNQSDWGVLFNRSNENDLLCLGVFLGQSFCDDPDQDLQTVNQDTETFLDIQSHLASLRADWVLGDVTLTSLSGWSSIREDKKTDFDGVPIPVFASIQPLQEDIISQEFRADWTIGDRMNLLVGVFGSNIKYDEGANSLFVFELLGLPEDTIEVVSREQETNQLGIFASADIEITDTVSVTAGGRYSYEEKDFAYRNGFNQTGGGFWPDAPGFNNVAEGTADWSRFTPMVSVQWEPQDDVLLYAQYAQGFKSGGFNGRGNSTDTIGPYDPEIVDSFELGLKSQWLDDRLLLNLAAFYSDYSDKQEEIIRTNPDTGATITLVDNAGAVNISGIEAEWSFEVTDGFRLFGTASYLDAEYDEFLFDGFDVADFVDPRNTPELQYTLNGQYQWFVPGFADFSALVSYRWTDDYETNLGPRFDGGGPSPLINDPRALVESFGILDASLQARFDMGGGKEGTVLLFVRNATNELFYDSFYPVANLWNMSTVNQPRTYGVQLGVDF